MTHSSLRREVLASSIVAIAAAESSSSSLPSTLRRARPRLSTRSTAGDRAVRGRSAHTSHVRDVLLAILPEMACSPAVRSLQPMSLHRHRVRSRRKATQPAQRCSHTSSCSLPNSTRSPRLRSATSSSAFRLRLRPVGERVRFWPIGAAIAPRAPEVLQPRVRPRCVADDAEASGRCADAGKAVRAWRRGAVMGERPREERQSNQSFSMLGQRPMPAASALRPSSPTGLPKTLRDTAAGQPDDTASAAPTLTRRT